MSPGPLTAVSLLCAGSGPQRKEEWKMKVLMVLEFLDLSPPSDILLPSLPTMEISLEFSPSLSQLKCFHHW